MSPKNPVKLAFLLTCCSVAAAHVGCNFFSAGTCYLPCGDPIRAAEYPLAFTDEARKGKEITVALFVRGSPGMGPEFAGCEDILIADLAKRLPELAEEMNHKLRVIDPARVKKYETNSAYWYYRHPREWGKQLDADYVFNIRLEKMSLFQEGSRNTIYGGQADVAVDVYDVDAGPIKPKYHYEYPFRYPHPGVAVTDSIPLSSFKANFLDSLATEIAKQHIQHKIIPNE